MTNAVTPALADAMRRMHGTRRFLGLGAVIGGLALLWVASRWAAGPTYVTLYRELELSSAASITDNLQKNGIRYRLENGGTEVLVPTADVPRARVLLAKDGLPAQGKPGLELFDKPTWGMTDFTQRITYRRALEGELSRTIGTLRGVERAQVHLALPETSPLRRLERPAEAAVVVTLKPGVRLTPDVVQGIAYIVSNSVEQLPADNVAVMDDSGRLLSIPADGGAAGSFGLTSRQLDLQHSIEKQLGDKVEGLLATVVGPGAARVSVSAQLNFEQVERTIESYDPDGQVLQTEQRSETGPDAESAAGSQTIISNQYQNSRKMERVIGATGTVNRLTVAVLVDEKALTAEAAKVGQPMEAQMAGLESAVRNAIGLDSVRGDRLTLTAMPFEPAGATALAGLRADSVTPPTDGTVVVERFSRPAILLVAIVLAFILAWRMLRPLPLPLPHTAPALAAYGAPAAIGGEPTRIVEFAPTLPSPSLLLRQRIQAESAERPETAAQVMRAWLAEG